jgi:hypothetical protein
MGHLIARLSPYHYQYKLIKLTWVELMAEDAQLNSPSSLSHIQADEQSYCQSYQRGLHFTYITIVAGRLLQKKQLGMKLHNASP